MKSLVIFGALLLLLGILGLVAPMFSTTHTKDVAKLGDLKLQEQLTETHVVPPLLAKSAIGLGAISLVWGCCAEADLAAPPSFHLDAHRPSTTLASDARRSIYRRTARTNNAVTHNRSKDFPGCVKTTGSPKQ
jgi:hypothetical protein